MSKLFLRTDLTVFLFCASFFGFKMWVWAGEIPQAHKIQVQASEQQLQGSEQEKLLEDGLKIQVKNPYLDDDITHASASSRWGLWYTAQGERANSQLPSQGLGLSYWWLGSSRVGVWSGLSFMSSQWSGAGQVRDQVEGFVSLRPQLGGWGAWSLSSALGVSYKVSRDYVRGSGLPVQSVVTATPVWGALQLGRSLGAGGLLSVQLRWLEFGTGVFGIGWEWF